MTLQNQKTDRELLEEINETSRKTKNYIKWQLIITVGLVVIPLLATLILIPIAMRSITSMYSSYGLDSLTGQDGESTRNTIQDLINQYSK